MTKISCPEELKKNRKTCGNTMISSLWKTNLKPVFTSVYSLFNNVYDPSLEKVLFFSHWYIHVIMPSANTSTFNVDFGKESFYCLQLSSFQFLLG